MRPSPDRCTPTLSRGGLSIRRGARRWCLMRAKRTHPASKMSNLEPLNPKRFPEGGSGVVSRGSQTDSSRFKTIKF